MVIGFYNRTFIEKVKETDVDSERESWQILVKTEK